MLDEQAHVFGSLPELRRTLIKTGLEHLSEGGPLIFERLARRNVAHRDPYLASAFRGRERAPASLIVLTDIIQLGVEFGAIAPPDAQFDHAVA